MRRKKAESNQRWGDAYDKASALNKAKAQYKNTKKERKQKIEETYKDIRKNTSVGEKIMRNDATRKKAAKYVVDHNLPIEQAKKRANREAMRNTAILLAAYGTMTVKMNR